MHITPLPLYDPADDIGYTAISPLTRRRGIRCQAQATGNDQSPDEINLTDPNSLTKGRPQASPA